MRTKLLAAALCLAVASGAAPPDDYSSAEWRGEIAHGYLPYRKLKFEEFPIANGSSTEYWMHTEGFFHYTFRSRWDQTDSGFTATTTSLSFRSGFDQNKSWKRDDVTETKALLEHEQGHLDIVELHADEFRNSKIPAGHGQTSQAALDELQANVRALCDRVEAESRAEQEKYDRETSHGANAQQQALWTTALRKRLDKAGVTYWDGSR